MMGNLLFQLEHEKLVTFIYDPLPEAIRATISITYQTRDIGDKSRSSHSIFFTLKIVKILETDLCYPCNSGSPFPKIR